MGDTNVALTAMGVLVKPHLLVFFYKETRTATWERHLSALLCSLAICAGALMLLYFFTSRVLIFFYTNYLRLLDWLEGAAAVASGACFFLACRARRVLKVFR